MELRHYRYFLAVAEARNFTRAAERLGMAQPPLSQQIQRMERELGVALFDRSHHRVSLTAAGAALVPEAYALLEQDARARNVTRSATGATGGRLRVAAMPSLLAGVMPGVVARMRETRPDVELAVQELDANEQRAALQQQRIDVGVGRSLRALPGFVTLPVGEERVVLALPRRHPHGSTAPVELAALRDERFVIFPRPHSPETYDAYIAACHGAGFSPRLAEQAIGDHAILGLVACGRGVALIPASTSRVRFPYVVYRELQQPAPTVPVSLTARARTEPAFVQDLKLVIARELRAMSRARGQRGPR